MISMGRTRTFRFGDYDPRDDYFMSGTALDCALAELAGEESVVSETTRTVKRWGQEATSYQWQVRIKK
jgi:hypothetical protein